MCVVTMYVLYAVCAYYIYKCIYLCTNLHMYVHVYSKNALFVCV